MAAKRLVDRRQFLRWGLAGGAVLAAGPLLAACGGEKPPAVSEVRSLSELVRQRQAAGAKGGLQVAMAAGDFLPGENRVPFGLLEPGADRADILAGRAQAWMQAQDGGPIAGPAEVTWHPFAKPEARPAPQGYYTARFTLDRAGVWNLAVEVETGGRRLVGGTALQALEKSATVAVGERALATPTPTFTKPLGVDPVCTRRPPCPFHEVSLPDALKGDRPIALLFATPMFCISRVCGPSVEELIAVASGIDERATFIHVEVYRDLKKSGFVKAFEEWRLQSEPWFFAVDGGVVRARLEGPSAADEMRAALSPLLS